MPFRLKKKGCIEKWFINVACVFVYQDDVLKISVFIILDENNLKFSLVKSAFNFPKLVKVFYVSAKFLLPINNKIN